MVWVRGRFEAGGGEELEESGDAGAGGVSLGWDSDVHSISR